MSSRTQAMSSRTGVDSIVALLTPEQAAAQEEHMLVSYLSMAVHGKHLLEGAGYPAERVRAMVGDELREAGRTSVAETLEEMRAGGVVFADGWREQAAAISERAIDRVVAALFPAG